MHKNTLLLTAFLAVIAALLVGLNVGRSLTKTPQAVPTPLPLLTPTISYMNTSACGVSFQYPNSMETLESSGSGIILVNTKKTDASIVIVCQKQIPRVPLPAEKIESLSIPAATGAASVSAKLYHDASPKDGTPIDKLIFTHPKTKLDVLIGGFGPVFRDLITSVKLE